MNSSPKRTLAIIGSALALGGIGTGLAVGATSSPNATAPPAAAVTTPPTTTDVPTPGDTVDTPSKDALTPGDKADTAMDRETADKAGQEGVENPAAEAADVSEPGEGTAADTGHQDPPGQIDSQDQGTR